MMISWNGVYRENIMSVVNTQKKEIGQSMVEFAISAIVILMLLVAVADLGRAFYTYLSIRDAAQEGAVFGAVCPQHVTQIMDRVKLTSQTPVDLNDPAHVQVTCYYISYDIFGNPIETLCSSGTAPSAGNGIKIGVTFDNFTVTTPLAGSLLGQTLTLRAEVTDTIIRVPELTEATCQ
jgi:hypothetical protein